MGEEGRQVAADSQVAALGGCGSAGLIAASTASKNGRRRIDWGERSRGNGVVRRGKEGGEEREKKDSSLPRSNNVWRLNSLPSPTGE